MTRTRIGVADGGRASAAATRAVGTGPICIGDQKVGSSVWSFSSGVQAPFFRVVTSVTRACWSMSGIWAELMRKVSPLCAV